MNGSSEKKPTWNLKEVMDRIGDRNETMHSTSDILKKFGPKFPEKKKK